MAVATWLIVLISVFSAAGLVASSVDAVIRVRRWQNKLFVVQCFVGNFLWVSLGGLVFPLFYVIWGVILMSFFDQETGEHFLQLAVFVLVPFGRAIVENRRDQAHAIRSYQYGVWCCLVGLWLPIVHLALSIAFGCSVVLFPLAVKHYRLVNVSAFPIGTEIRFMENSREEEDAEVQENITDQLNNERFYEENVDVDSSNAASPAFKPLQ
eukprot:TRINITY_DN8383_c0_g1_i1.p1 TRINITY_DN8383_c0_g1~~TRINITY_DN8383_c0_g1_i1.p1  ORF type:complete len:210 (+),score=49.04 TRINITY_DN8383_c0_g1_i1:53-682(+)